MATLVRPSVLLVDDEPEILHSTAYLLEDDFVVMAFEGAESALKALDDIDISVIVADQRMPGLAGDAFLARAKERSDATRILMTGYADIEALIRAINDGQIYTYLAKPWEPRHFKLTVRKAAEHRHLTREALRERNLLHALMDNIPDAIWFQDASGRFTDLNESTAAVLGLADASLAIGKRFDDFIELEDARTIQAEEENVIRSRRAVTNKLSYLRSQREGARWMSTTIAPILGKDGTAAGLIGVSRDVTDHKQAELALKQSEESYRQIIETTAEGVWIFDEALNTTFVNDKMAVMLGRAPEQMLGKPVAELLGEGYGSQAFENLIACNRARRSLELRLRKTDGSEICAIVSGCPLPDSAGRPRGTLAMFTDVTELKTLEDQFRQSQKLDAVGQLAGSLAHDFNNILSVITGHSQLLLRRLESDSPLRNPVEKIGAACDHAANLTRQLLSFSKRRVVKAEIINLNTVVENFVKMCRPIIPKEVQLITKLDAPQALVRADAGQLDQLLMNLVLNARDAMPDGGTITIATQHVDLASAASSLKSDPVPEPQVLLSISDTGIGMDVETRTHAFEPFFTTKEEGKGTGLGLSIVYGIIRQHAGRIELKTETGQGACFSIYLPRVTGEIRDLPSVQGASQWPRGEETILVVEDGAVLREVIADVLRTCGYQVLEAGNGHDGLSIFESHPQIDLVLTDLAMPGLNGAELAKLLKARKPEIKVLYMSGSADHAPADGPLIQKPFKPASLACKIRDVLDYSRQSTSILIADDDSEIRDLMRCILEDEGYRVFTAENGKKATAILQKQAIHLMFTDLVMPEQEGMETIAKARKDCPNLKIVAVSGAFAGSLLDAASHFGASAILEKPLQIDAVLRVVHDLLGPATCLPSE